LKRLDIICKSKGLPRPQRRTLSNASGGARGSNYVSPYRQGPGSQNANKSRGASNNSANRKPSPFKNFNYTPPNKRNMSPSGYSNGSGNKFRTSPMNTGGFSNNSTSLRNQQQSPGAKSNTSNKSGGSQNRLYSPSGRIRTNSNLYGSNA
jgi:hypothetical protein